jgi:hypothetical protein
MKVFISHTARDEKIAIGLTKALKEKSFLVFFGQDFSSESQISSEIDSELKNSDAIVAILSKHSFSSEWVRKELNEALFNEKFKDRFFPVLLSSNSEDLSRLPWVLQKISHFRISPVGSPEAIGKKIAIEFSKFISRGK